MRDSRTAAGRRAQHHVQRRGRAERVAGLALLLRLAAVALALQEEDGRSVRHARPRRRVRHAVLRGQQLPDTVVHGQVLGRVHYRDDRVQTDHDT